jgi:adenine-specific DNA-methyltransferase
VIKRIIKVSSNVYDLVFDPFMGSGTTAVAALDLGRCALGFEIKSDYCKIAADRIDNFLIKSEHSAEQIALFQ